MTPNKKKGISYDTYTSNELETLKVSSMRLAGIEPAQMPIHQILNPINLSVPP